MPEDSTPARIFVAIDLSHEARQIVAAAQKRIRARAGASLRVVPEDQLHLTLAFKAAVDRSRVPAIVAAIERGFDQSPFRLVLSGLGVLPPRGRPRVLYIAVTVGADDVVTLQRSVAARLAEQGIELEERAFRPHLTLARWRVGHSAEARRIVDSNSPAPIEQEVRSVTLYQSRLSSNGAVHTPLAAGQLKTR